MMFQCLHLSFQAHIHFSLITHPASAGLVILKISNLTQYSTFVAQLSQWLHIQYIPDTANNYTRCYQLIYLMLPIPIPESTNTYPWFYQYLSLMLPLHIPDTTTKYSWCFHYLSLRSLLSKPDAWLKTCTDFCGLENKISNLTANSS